MILAVKVNNLNGKMNLSQLALDGLKKFRQAPHTQDYQPAAIEVSPKDRERFPEKFKINNIPVIANPELEPGTLRVCTANIAGLEDSWTTR